MSESTVHPRGPAGRTGIREAPTVQALEQKKGVPDSSSENLSLHSSFPQRYPQHLRWVAPWEGWKLSKGDKTLECVGQGVTNLGHLQFTSIATSSGKL